MKLCELIKIVLDFATERGTPFTTAEAFGAVEEAETGLEVSQSLGSLYRNGYLKRKKIDGKSYQYCIADKAPKDFVSGDGRLKEGNKPAIDTDIDDPAKQDAPAQETTPTPTPAPQKPPAAANNTPATYLETAKQIVHGDRERTYGDPGKNLRLIASYWSAHLKIQLTENDVCILMMLLKIARLNNDLEHDDSWIDIAGYVALKDKMDKHNQTSQ